MAQVVARYNLLAVPVVDDDGRLVGIVTVDDAIDTVLPVGLEAPPAAAPLSASADGSRRRAGTGRPPRTSRVSIVRHESAARRRAARACRRRRSIARRPHPLAEPSPGPPRGGDFLRLRGRFRGRRGLIAFLAVMGPGLIAGIAGNDAGGITTYSVLGADDRADAALAVPDHDRRSWRSSRRWRRASASSRARACPT